MSWNTWYSPPPVPRARLLPKRRSSTTDVGIIAPNYGLEHVTYLLSMERYRHVLMTRAPLYRWLGNRGFWDKAPVVLPARVPLVHTFNLTPLNGPPFVVSFEMELPHLLASATPRQVDMIHSVLASPRCRAILSLSDTARDLAKAKFDGLGQTAISEKIDTFRGGVLPSGAVDRPDRVESGPLRLIFVGANGFRKGLVPLLDAVQAVRGRGLDVELTVVSSLPGKTYAVPKSRLEQPSAQDLRARMSEASWVTHHPSLPYAEVRRLMGTHDLLMLPTLDETLGWVVIEAAMEGMATVASNAFALTELVDDGVTGRLLHLPLNENRRWTGLFAEDREAAYDDAVLLLKDGLVRTLSEVANDRRLVRRWGDAARLKLEGLYHPDVAAAQLTRIYDRAIG